MILITGAEGFIGKHLLEMSGEAYGIDINNKYEYYSYNDITHVYHLGAVSSTTETDIEKIYRNNVKYSIELFEWCIKHKIPVSYASSASVYGNVPGHINPLNYYAMSKAMLDLWVKDNMHRFELIRGYRFFNVYGEGEEHKGNQASPIYQFTKQAIEKKEITIFDKEGDGRRDFIHVDDVCRVMLEDTRDSGIYDVGTGITHTFSEVASMIAEKYDASIRVVAFPDHLKGKYQFYTCASTPVKDAISVQQHLNRD